MKSYYAIVAAVFLFASSVQAESDTIMAAYGIRLIVACRENNISEVALVLSRGANINFVSEDGKTALSTASLCGNLKVVDFLLRNGADVNLEADVISIVTGGYLEIQCGTGSTALMMAASKGYIKIVKLLLEYGADTTIYHTEHLDRLMLVGYGRVVKPKPFES